MLPLPFKQFVESDALLLDESRLGLGYQIHPFIYLFMDYIWTFERNSTTGRLESQRRVEPQFSTFLNFSNQFQTRGACYRTTTTNSGLIFPQLYLVPW
jgi:hypothetical protein